MSATRTDEHGPRAALPLADAITAEDAATDALVVGTPYRIVRRMAEGGMGEVFEAEHVLLSKRCALKFLRQGRPAQGDSGARLRREARLLARIQHPNLVDVFDLGVASDGRPYLAMELLRGRDLRHELTHRGALPAREALTLVAQALDGLSAAHEAGVIHRDVKLANLFLCDDGRLKVLDFGVAKLLRGAEAPPSRKDLLIGSPRTMAPEQCALNEVDPRTDLYAAGLVLYELVTGRGPFDDLSGEALMYAHCRRTPPPPSRFAKMPRSVEAAILRAIAKAPDDRFASAAAMSNHLRALANALGGASQAPSRASESDPVVAASELARKSEESTVAPRRPPTPRPSRDAAMPALVAAILAIAIESFALGQSYRAHASDPAPETSTSRAACGEAIRL